MTDKKADKKDLKDYIDRLRTIEHNLETIGIEIQNLHDRRVHLEKQADALGTFLKLTMDPEDFRDEFGYYPRDER